MKITGIVMIAGLALVATSFTLTEKANSARENSMVKPTTYALNKEKSSLEWKGGKSEAYFHQGTVSFSDGSLVMEKDDIVSGIFTVDMATIKVSDDMPEGKIEYLTKHLQNADFFNTSEFPTVSVTINGYTDGMLSTTLTVLGVTLENNVPVKIVNSQSEVLITGDFAIDFGALNMPGMQPNPESGERISSTIEYKLNLVVTK